MADKSTYGFARGIMSTSSVNPITPIGKGVYGTSLQYPMQRYIQYTERDWRYCVDQMVNSAFGMPWAQIVTWMLSADPFIQALIFKRLSPITSLRYVIQDEEGVIDDELTNRIKDRWFHQLIEAIMMAIFQGFSGIQIDFKNNSTTNYPLELIDYKQKALKFAFYELTGTTIFNDHANMAWFEYNRGHQTALGLYQPMTFEYISMATTNINWVAFTTNTAFPIRTVNYMSGNEATDYLRDAEGNIIYNPITGLPETKNYNQLKDWAVMFAEQNSPNAIVALPMSYDEANGNIIKQIQIEDSTLGAHTGTAYKACQDRIELGQQRLSLLVLGSVLTTLPGSSRALGEVHERASDKIIESDRKWVLDCLNDIMLPKLNFPEGYKFAIDDSESMSLEEAQRYSDIVKENNRELGDEFFSKIGLPNNYISKVEPEEQEIEVKEEIVKKVPKKVVRKEKKERKTALNNVWKRLGLNFINPHPKFDEVEVIDIVEEEVIETIIRKEIIQKEIPKSKLNFKNYDLESCEVNMSLSSNTKLYEPTKKEFEKYFMSFELDKKKNMFFKDKNNNKIILNNINDKISKIGFDLFKDTALNADELWKTGDILNYIKYYNNVVYNIKTCEGELIEAKCLRSYKDVELLRNGELL